MIILKLWINFFKDLNPPLRKEIHFKIFTISPSLHLLWFQRPTQLHSHNSIENNQKIYIFLYTYITELFSCSSFRYLGKNHPHLFVYGHKSPIKITCPIIFFSLLEISEKANQLFSSNPSSIHRTNDLSVRTIYTVYNNKTPFPL